MMTSDPSKLTLPELLDGDFGDAVAVASLSGQRLSHRQLSAHVAALASRLAALGVGRADDVLFISRNGPAAAIGFLAIATAAIARPINPGLSARQVAAMAAEIAPKAVVAEEGAAEELARAAGVERILKLAPAGDGLTFEISGSAVGAPQAITTPSPDDIALGLQSSGTTGRPKTIKITHANLARSAANIRGSLSLGPDDRLVNVMPLFHIHGLLAGLLAPLSAGGGVLTSPGFDPEAFLDWAVAFGATWHTAVPTMHQNLLAAARRRDPAAPQPAFRFLRSSSSELPRATRDGLEQLLGLPMIEAYGMTEATHQMTTQRPDDAARPHGSVGRAAGIDVGVADPERDEVAVRSEGEGEVVIRGATLAQVDGAAPLLPGGWMRTGDLGRLDATGALFLTGRIKEIVKRGGFQIAPREVEDALLDAPGVAVAVAFGAPHETLGQDLVAAITPRDGAELDPAGLRRALFDKLAPYQVPSRILTLDQIPLGATGKLQRAQLAQMLADRLETPYAAPESPIEALVIEIFEEVSPGRRVGRDDDFFFAGGDSLSGARAIARLRELFDAEIPTGALFENPTAADFAAYLTRFDGGRLARLIEETLGELGDEAGPSSDRDGAS